MPNERCWLAFSALGFGIEVGEGEPVVAEELFGFEEARDFVSGGFGGVGGVDEVGLDAHAEVATDGAGGGFAGFGNATDAADCVYAVDALPAGGDNGGEHHELLDVAEEGEVAEVRVVF